MKVEIELSVDGDGKPIIIFRHHDKDNSLEQKLLKIFVNEAKDKGIKISNPSGHLEIGGASWENYEISINDD